MSGFVYFISYPRSGWVKIGYAKSVKARLAQLQCSSPEFLKVEATVASPVIGERRLHRALTSARRGEWFQRSLEIEMAIDMARNGSSIDEIISSVERDAAQSVAAKKLAMQVRWERLSKDPGVPEDLRPIYAKFSERAKLDGKVTPIERAKLKEKARRVAVAAASVA